MTIDELLASVSENLRFNVKQTYEMCIERLGYTEEDSIKFTQGYLKWAEILKPLSDAARDSERIPGEDYRIIVT
ncbi:hypothetical protein J4476_03260 [Candidatus Woesearchaeota archaeon]|nr:MAG: hypothetical protein QT09_C0006G0037 [archaeon GW2011_AR18]MBS3161687.1 hypothetical protein [Candidatus Woesearchaeota archaeon]HIH25697.1 hypothetical protein [Nanoarchaeota archaeon]